MSVKTIGDMGENGLLTWLQETSGGTPTGVVNVGIGDDAAVLDLPGSRCVVTTDALCQGVDFDFAYMSAAEVGRKAVAVNLSDLAAMGARPVAILATIIVPSTFAQSDFKEMLTSMRSAAGEYGAFLVGGDLSEPPKGDCGVTLSVVAIGTIPSEQKPILRSGAKVGDLLCVTGTVGDSAAGLDLMRSHKRNALTTPQQKELLGRHIDPTPRCAAGRALSRVAHAMIDVSDGVALDAARLAQASGLSLELNLQSLPLSAAFESVAQDKQQLALMGGEDYELLIAVQPQAFAHAKQSLGALQLTQIGTFVAGPPGVLRDTSGRPIDLGPSWQHFR